MPIKRERVITVGLVVGKTSKIIVEEHLAELGKLAETAGGEIVANVVASRPSIDPATYVGSGKAEEIGQIASREKAALVVFDDDLSPAQIRNLEKAISVKVIDRSALILDIFARGARSREARTQVELAQLSYLLPRLTRQWSHLSRQAGGIGTRGVGETQLEIDRRIIRTRIARLKEDLRKIEQNRSTQRKARRSVYTVALVGYTNAGKSTLFNRLTEAEGGAADKLFATLDSKAQRSAFEMPRKTVFVDTVGFIRKLPHHLVASFRSTMEEAVLADLVLHVIDASHSNADEQREVGNEVLADLGVDPKRVLEVYNKSDQLEEHAAFEQRGRDSVFISALNGTKIDRLLEMVRQRELAEGVTVRLEIPFTESRAIAQLHELADVQEESQHDGFQRFLAWVPSDSLHLFEAWKAGTEGGGETDRT